MLKKGRPKSNRAPTYCKTIALEAALPVVVKEQLGIAEMAKLAGVHTSTANRFLARKAEEYSATNKARFLHLEPRHAAAFNAAAERQMEWLEALNDKPRHQWDAADFKLERHALSCLKSLAPFLELAAHALAKPSTHKAIPDAPESENPNDSEPPAPATLGDGL